jgi:hypothetical protein
MPEEAKKINRPLLSFGGHHPRSSSNASEVASINSALPSAIKRLQFALPCEFGKFGSLTYPTGKQSIDQFNVIRGKVLTQNEGLAMVPLLIPEQPTVFRLEHNPVCPTRRKPDATSAEAFP